MTKITLKPGDYVSTEGMTEEQYHAIVGQMRTLGANDKYAYPSHAGRRHSFLMWDDENDIDAGPSLGRCSGRHLTIGQVLGEGEGGTLLLLAEADKHARKAAKHEAKRKECIDKARALMPEVWGIDEDRKRIRLGDEPKEDMSDPANWREGDVVECIRSISDTSKGGLYTLEIDPSDGRLSHRDDVGDWCFLFENHFRLHHRPS